jgi:hypothetical protein
MHHINNKYYPCGIDAFLSVEQRQLPWRGNLVVYRVWGSGAVSRSVTAQRLKKFQKKSAMDVFVAQENLSAILMDSLSSTLLTGTKEISKQIQNLTIIQTCWAIIPRWSLPDVTQNLSATLLAQEIRLNLYEVGLYRFAGYQLINLLQKLLVIITNQMGKKQLNLMKPFTSWRLHH